MQYQKFISNKAVALVLIAVCASLFAANIARAKNGGATPMTISLIALSDFHGNILPLSGTALVPDMQHPEGSRVALGGAAYIATLVKTLKAHNPRHTLLVAAGDLIGASPPISGMFHDEPTIDVLDQLGLQFSSVGNHEFDKGRAELMRLQRGGCFPASTDGSTGKVGIDTCMKKGQFKGARYKYLAANVIDVHTGKTLFPGTEMRTVGGVKIGFIGLTLKATPTVVTPAGVEGLRFADEVETVNALVPQLQARGATVIVVLLHQGGATTAKTLLDKSCPGFSGDVLAVADRMSAAVDLVITGHTHQEYVCFRPDGKLITQSGSYGRLLTKVDLVVDGVTKKVLAKDANNQLVLNGLPVKDAAGNPLPLPSGYVALQADPAMAQLVRRYGDLSATITDVVVGHLAGPLDRRLNAAGESTLGAVIADTYLSATSDNSYGDNAAQIAFTNHGGIRSDLTSSLSVTFGQLFSVLPFNNYLVTMDLTGQQLLRLLEQQWESPQPATGRMMAVSNGFSYTWDASTPDGAAPGTGARVVPGSMALHGEPIDMNKSYRITVNSFMASGGDNFTMLRQGTKVQDGDIDSALAKLYFQTRGVVQVPALNRVTRLN
jgi:5'-nucleotidase